MAELFKTVIKTEDGMEFDTKAEALDYLRKPKVMEELNKLTNNNSDLNELIYSHQEILEDIFSAGAIQRVTKSERKQLEKALAAIKVIEDNKAFLFVVEHAGAILDSFKWPAVKKIDDEEKTRLIHISLMNVTENNTALTDWIIAQKDAIFLAFEAGKLKREVPAKAAEGLAAYKAKKLLEKQEKLAAATLAIEGTVPEESTETDGFAEAVV